MRSGFPGFPAEGMQFLRGLARNNNRDWFLPRKPVYETKVKAPMADLVHAVNGALMEFAPEYVTDPADAIYRAGARGTKADSTSPSPPPP